MDGPSNSPAGIHPARAVWCSPPAGGPYRVLKNMCSVCCSSVFSPSLFPSVASAPFFNFSDIQKGRRLGIDETTKSAPYSLLYVFRKGALCFSSKRAPHGEIVLSSPFRGRSSHPRRREPPKISFQNPLLFESKKTATTWNCKRSAYNIRIVAVFWNVTTSRIFIQDFQITFDLHFFWFLYYLR